MSGVGFVLIVAGAAASCAILADLDNTYESTGGGDAASASASSPASASSGSGGSSGGAGGAGGTAGGGGAGGLGGMGGAAGPVYEWTATDPTLSMGGGSECGKYAYSLPDWLAFESPTAVRSTQISDAALCVGFTPNEARARNVAPAGAPKWGLSVESSRTNNVLQSDSWNVPVNNSGWLASQSDPSVDLKLSTNEPDPNIGGAAESAARFSTTAVPPITGQHSRYFLTEARVVSTWARGDGNPGLGCMDPLNMQSELCFAHFRYKNLPGAYVNVKSTQWQRLSIVYTVKQADALTLETRDVPAGAGVVAPPVTFLAYGAQAEPIGAYPSSYIRTENTPVTRAAEKLYATSTSALLPGGFFKITMKVAPNFSVSSALNEQLANEYNLLFLALNSRLYLNKGDRKLYLTISGDSVVSAPLELAREQELTITAEHSDGSPLKLRVEGALSGNGEWVGEPAQAVENGKTLYILSKDSGAEECADLRYIRFE